MGCLGRALSNLLERSGIVLKFYVQLHLSFRKRREKIFCWVKIMTLLVKFVERVFCMLQQRPTTPLLKQEVLIAQHIVLCKSRLLHTAPADGNNPLMFSTHHLLEVTPIRKQRQENWKGFYAKAEGLLKYPLPSSKGIILRSIQRIICSLHTHEPEMKISKLARRVWDNLRRAMYGRIGMQRI